jgi:hypothetical protein
VKLAPVNPEPPLSFALFPLTFNLFPIMHLSPLKEKILTITLCVLGIPAVAFGMAKHNNPIFILGLLLVIAGYLTIRRKLKDSIQKK